LIPKTAMLVEVIMRRLRALALLLTMVALATAPAWAADEPQHAAQDKHAAAGAKDNHGGKGGDHEASGEIDIFKPALDLSIWTLVVFGVLLFVLGKFAWKPMLEGLRKREEGIRNAIHEAEQTRTEAHRLRDQLQNEFNNANAKVREIIDDARRDAERTTQDMIAKARTEIQTERDRLRREIGMARDQALQEIWQQSAQLATLISAKAIRKKLAPDDHRRLVDEALGELRAAGSEWQRQGAGTPS
jgi:F-type H+-transporting ATPase subunit b